MAPVGKSLERGRHACIISAIAMSEHSLARIAETSDEKVSTPAYRVLYDGQCEICQACVSWLRTLDRKSRTICLSLSAEVLPTIDSRLKMDECLRQLHVVTPEDEIHVGWDAVTCLARLFSSTWLIGVLGQRFPLRNAGRLLYGICCHEQILPSVAVVRAAPQNQKQCDGKPN